MEEEEEEEEEERRRAYKAGKICRLRRKGVARGHVERNLTQTRETKGLVLHFSFPIFFQILLTSLGDK